jgi:hypothetical protein
MLNQLYISMWQWLYSEDNYTICNKAAVTQIYLCDLYVLCYADYGIENTVFPSPAIFEWHENEDYLGIRL